MALHEFDWEVCAGDDWQNVGKDTGIGIPVAKRIRGWEKTNPFAPPLDRVLCLGAGTAYPELEFARALGIPASGVILLDKSFASQVLLKIKERAPGVTIIETGLYTFMRDFCGVRFPLITGFGLHDVLKNLPKLDEFFRLLPGVLLDGGVVYTGNSAPPEGTVDVAARYGFSPISEECSDIFTYRQ